MAILAFDGILPKIHRTAFVHPHAVVIGDVRIGARCSIWPGVVIRGDVNRIRIGRGTNIQDGSILHVSRPTEQRPQGAPLFIGNNVNIGHRVILHGCVLMDGCMIGMGAVVMDDVCVGEEAMVGAAGLVTPGKELLPREVWMGAPARMTRLLTDDEVANHRAIAENYIRLAQRHRRAKRDR